jgi:hypothetical protein
MVPAVMFPDQFLLDEEYLLSPDKHYMLIVRDGCLSLDDVTVNPPVVIWQSNTPEPGLTGCYAEMQPDGNLFSTMSTV